MYGEPKELLQQDATGMKFVNVQLINSADGRSVEQKLLRNIEVSMLRMKARRLFKLDPMDEHGLICRSKANPVSCIIFP